VHNQQFNFVWWKTLLVVAALFFGVPSLAATMARPSKPDPLLDGGPTAPCAAGADYAAGTDANGRPVVPADVAAGRVPLPDTVAIPLGGNGGNNRGGNRGRGGYRGRPNPATPDGAYVTLDGQKLEPLLNPQPCTDPGR